MTQPLDDVRVTRLCEKAQLSSMSFYAHYENKYDLARQVVMDEAEEHAERLFSLARSQLQGVEGYDQKRYIHDSAALFFEGVSSRPTLYACIFQDYLMPDAISAFAHYATEKLNERFVFFQRGMNSRAYYEDFIMDQSIIMLMNTARYWSKREFDLPAVELADVYRDFYFNRMIDLHFTDERAETIEVTIAKGE